MMMPLNIAIPALIISLLAGIVSGAWGGYEFATGQQAKEEQLVAKVQEAASISAANAIANIEIKNTTIRQEVQREIIENVVYRDCHHTPDGMRLINDALRGFSTGDVSVHRIE